MNNPKLTFQHLFLLVLISLGISITSYGQPEQFFSVEYRQISSFPTDYGIVSMKISGDGSRIIFSTGGAAIKVFTMNIDGSGLKEIYNFEGTGFGPFVDINGTGDKVTWCIGYGEIFTANADGSALEEVATLLPNPDTNFGDLEPVIPLPPRITEDGTQVFFINMDRDPRVSGVWRINTDGSGLTQEFNYLKMASNVFGADGTEYNRNTAFADGFDINGDGSRMILGTKIFKLQEGDLDRGDAIVVDGTEFYEAGEYAVGWQPFCTNRGGDQFMMFRREYNEEIQFDEINVYFVPIGTGDPIKVIGGLDIFGTSTWTQIAAGGSRGIVHAGNGRMPITFVDRISKSRNDLVSIDGISNAPLGYRFSNSYLPSMDVNADRFIFLAPSAPPQIWVGKIGTSALSTLPKISNIKFEPSSLAVDGSTMSTFEAEVTNLDKTIHTVTFDAIKDGVFQFRGLTADFPGGMLYDDGTVGDKSASDHFFTNNTVRVDLPETPIGTYSVRIAAMNETLREITMVDVDSVNIVEPATSVYSRQDNEPGFHLHQNYPNPFQSTSSIIYEIPQECYVDIRVFDVMGQEITTLVSSKKGPGQYSVDFISKDLPGGVYFYVMRAGDNIQVRKLQVFH